MSVPDRTKYIAINFHTIYDFSNILIIIRCKLVYSSVPALDGIGFFEDEMRLFSFQKLSIQSEKSCL